MLHAIQRYRYLFALLFFLLAVSFGSWSWVILSHLFHHSTPYTILVPLNHEGQLQKVPSTTPPPISEHTVHSGVHLIIPIIGVNAPLEAVGIAADGSMAVPTQHPWNGIGWYKYGPYPGEPGSAVLAGHLNRPNGIPAVLWKLWLLHPGDLVIIKDKTGKGLRFRVTGLKFYALARAPRREIFGRHGGVFLNIITCAGIWLPTLHQTSQRLVVYTELIRPARA